MVQNSKGKGGYTVRSTSQSLSLKEKNVTTFSCFLPVILCIYVNIFPSATFFLQK